MLQIKCKTRIQVQKGIERMYGIIANMESTITQMGLQKGESVNCGVIISANHAGHGYTEGMRGNETAQRVFVLFPAEL